MRERTSEEEQHHDDFQKLPQEHQEYDWLDSSLHQQPFNNPPPATTTTPPPPPPTTTTSRKTIAWKAKTYCWHKSSQRTRSCSMTSSSKFLWSSQAKSSSLKNWYSCLASGNSSCGLLANGGATVGESACCCLANGRATVSTGIAIDSCAKTFQSMQKYTRNPIISSSWASRGRKFQNWSAYSL